MATLALAAAGAAVGGAILPAGVSVLGATVSGAALGSQLGALAGSYVDQALFGSSGESRVVEGPRLRDLHVTTSTAGAPIPILIGRARLGGQVIWATDFEEVATTTTQTSGGAGGGKGAPSTPSVQQVDYQYFANFAVAICEGVTTALVRVWADGVEVDVSRFIYRFYTGEPDQVPDSLISSVEGAAAAPAFRNVSYIVFERLPLAEFGNRLPQFSFEVVRMREDSLHRARGVVIIPGSGEFVYGTQSVVRSLAPGQNETENTHSKLGGTDWSVSMDQMAYGLPDVQNASLVVSWFGTDLRAGVCEIRPGVEQAQKSTSPWTWTVSGVDRSAAHLVSLRDGRPAYGGTPSDVSVISAIKDLKARGIGVTLTPFVLMDVPSGNALPDPYGGDAQAVYPWRGRISCFPAPGVLGTFDLTAAAASQITSFVGTAQPEHFSISGETVQYAGPAEWTYRRMVLHQAWLARAAGGVDAFLIGSELRGLTTVRSGSAHFPFVDALIELARDVREILGPGTKITYAADWSEYFGYQPGDGSGDVYFHLDALWATPEIDAIGIDCYWPLSDWRDGVQHRDALDGARSTYDLDYLKGNLTGGEGFDWYYASAGDRSAQVRSLITDGQGKPWVFRFKDVQSWWKQPHYHRPGGIEALQPTSWVPQSKPIWFTEIGCPAIDKGANQPNVFVDPKSSENAVPYHSSGARDDFIQRRYLQAFMEHYSDDHVTGVDERNPISTVYGGRMVDPDRIYCYCWDARPYPAFPTSLDVWGDGGNWYLGHWLNGRTSSVSLGVAVEDLVVGHAPTDVIADVMRLDGLVPGFVLDRVMSPRDALQPLGLAFFFDVVESGWSLRFQHRFNSQDIPLLFEADLIEENPNDVVLSLKRRQETELPASAKLTYVSGDGGYEQAVAEARRLTGASGRVSQAELPIVLDPHQARSMAETWLHEVWAARETATFSIGARHFELEPGDVVRIGGAGLGHTYRIMDVRDRGPRQIEAMRLDGEVYGSVVSAWVPPAAGDAVAVGTPDVTFVDLPLLTGSEDPNQGYLAAYQEPWPGGLAVYSSPDDAGFELRRVAAVRSGVGELSAALAAGVPWRVDYANVMTVAFRGGTLQSLPQTQVLGGANLLAVQHADQRWEVVQFLDATLIGDGAYALSGLLRGQAGTESVMRENGDLAAGARVVRIDASLAPVFVSPDEIGLPLNWKVGPANQSLGGTGYDSVV
ncbi:MAG: glycoside hydrolase/phage tail family protein, partial [Pseudomonadota bacterium]